jgi:hypothetical protein
MTLSPEKYLAITLPITIICLMAGAAVVYWSIGDWRRGLYWTAAAVLNIAITV